MRQLKRLMNVLKAVSDQTPSANSHDAKAEIPLCMWDICCCLTFLKATVSRHLKQLKDLEYILEEKDGKWVNYSLNNDLPASTRVQKMITLICEELIDDDQMIADQANVNSVSRFVLCCVKRVNGVINKWNKRSNIFSS